MGLRETADFNRLVDGISRAIDKVPNIAAAEAVNFTKERFVQQNWYDQTPRPWQQRKKGWGNKKERGGRAILTKTARLKRSIRKIAANSNYIIIGTDTPYAQIHNDGGRYTSVQQVNTYGRKAYRVKSHNRTRAGRTERVKAFRVKESTVKAHRRTISVNMPQRRFLGPSAELNRRLVRRISLHISNAITAIR